MTPTGIRSWRAAIRIARRDAWRNKGRSALVLAMIALPIVGVSAADITIRSSDLSAAQELHRQLGAADARLSDAGYDGAPIYQSPDKNMSQPANKKDEDDWGRGVVQVARMIPSGETSLIDTTGRARFHTVHGLLDTDIRELKASDPLAAGIMDLDRGRFPSAPDEVAVTNAFLKTSGLHVGSQLTARYLGAKYRIVGAYDLPDELKQSQINALPGALLKPLDAALKAAGRPGTSASSTYLVSAPGGFTWNMVQQANARGVYVQSRMVTLHPPADSQVPLYVHNPGEFVSASGNVDQDLLTVAATVAGMAMLEICLLAGPAFAVGARRSRRQLGLVGANGGDRRHIRAIVLSGGLVIGVAAAVIGSLLGLGLTVALRGTLESYVGKRFGGLALRPLELGGICLLAVLTGLAAAIVPAVTASRQSVLASLTGRRGVRHANRVLPVIGLVAALLGAALAVFGSMRTDDFLIVSVGSAIAELGVVALTPTLVGLFGRLSRWLPLSPRLALRDAVRNRGRTAPAVAAVLAAVAGTVAVATYTVSGSQESRDEYTPMLPYSAVSVSLPDQQGRDLGVVRAAIEKEFPIAGRADVSRPVTGKKTCVDYSSDPGCGNVEMVTPAANVCPNDTPAAAGFTPAQRRAHAKDWRCANWNFFGDMSTSSGVLIGGSGVLKALKIDDPAAERALDRGETVLFDKRDADSRSRMSLRLVQDASLPVPDGKVGAGPVVSVPVHVSPSSADRTYGVTAVMPPGAAKAAGIRTAPFGTYYTEKQLPTSAEQQALNADFDKLGVDPAVRVERGYVEKDSAALLALSIFAGLVTIGAAGIATGLAQADAEPDLKTLAAIGSAPRVRRMLSGFQCGVVAVMGVLLGSAAGLLPAIGLRRAEYHHEEEFYRQSLAQGWSTTLPHVPIVIPWATLGELIIVVPLGAALLAALVTRSRTALTRRAEG